MDTDTHVNVFLGYPANGYVCNRNPLYPKERSRTGTTRAEKKRKWKLLIFAPLLMKAVTSYCFYVEC